jgi:hypothetical protein
MKMNDNFDDDEHAAKQEAFAAQARGQGFVGGPVANSILGGATLETLLGFVRHVRASDQIVTAIITQLGGDKELVDGVNQHAKEVMTVFLDNSPEQTTIHLAAVCGSVFATVIDSLARAAHANMTPEARAGATLDDCRLHMALAILLLSQHLLLLRTKNDASLNAMVGTANAQ